MSMTWGGLKVDAALLGNPAKLKTVEIKSRRRRMSCKELWIWELIHEINRT